MSATFILTAGVLLFISVTVILSSFLWKTQPTPYMDEIFHIPQAQQYCAGNYTHWDPMITTLPGLYVLSVGYLKLISAFTDASVVSLCSVRALRAGNVVLCIANVYLIHKLLKKSQPHQTTDTSPALQAFTLASLPVLYFTSFFFYTDTFSTFFVLHMYLFSAYDNHLLASFIGILSVVSRQINIVWVIFVCGLTTADCVLKHVRLNKKDIDINGMSDWKMLATIAHHLVLSVRNVNGLIALIVDVVVQIWSYVIVGVLFLLFVIWNDGLAVGDKNHHTVCLHVPQIFYFLSFSLCHSVPLLLNVNVFRNFVAYVRYNYAKVALFCLTSVLVIHKFTYAHEYLLADNRHYTFYIWSKIYRRHDSIKYLLIPVYGFSVWFHSQQIQHKNILWKLIFVMCLIFSIVPIRLLEFRYFIIPYVIFCVNTNRPEFYQQVLQLVMFTIMNVVTVVLFIYKPFKWDNSPDDWQRFMW